MTLSPLSRSLILVVLVGCLFGLTIWYGSLQPNPEAGHYPSFEQLSTNYDRYLGQSVVVAGSVQDTQPILISSRIGPRNQQLFTITNVDARVTPGQYLRVFGIAQANHRIEAIETMPVSETGRIYSYTVSFLAGLWVLGRLAKSWAIDPSGLGLIPRAKPLSWSEMLSRSVSGLPGRESS